ncbi:MAG: IS1595 family transposase [Acidimicrobiaceae bacterium]|nr:IS1595 family transposase [Acidimicrobiaceae bacterium]MYH78637.1 IS1595 family transposase [Acidimicrobiaceae bacterium]MYK66518.1 IS1595 family transposase [Gemmatimonadota bacterium]
MTEKKNPQTKAPGKAFRKGMTIVELIRRFPDDATAEAWIASIRWPDGPECPRCGCTNVQTPTAHKTMPYRCRGNGCRRFFSVKVGTVMQDSKLGYQEWAIAIYLYNTNLKSVSSMKLHRDLGICQKSAWHLAHRVRQCWDDLAGEPFDGSEGVEVDEAYFGGKAHNMSARQRRDRIHGRGVAGKTPVVAIKDRATNAVRATVVEATDKATLQGFVTDHAGVDAMVYTDEHGSYRGLPKHRSVRHSVGQYVDGMAHVNGCESFWSMLRRGYHGTFHHVSAEHLDRYVQEFAGRHSRRSMDTIDMMADTVRGMVGKQLTYTDLVAAGPGS